MSILHINIITSFPEIFPGPLEYSICGKALKEEIWSYNIINIRDFGKGRHKKIDDSMYGGGSGLIMRADVLEKAIESKFTQDSKIYYPSPRGVKFSQKLSCQMAQEKEISLLCGRFEGIDERIIEYYNITEISLGDYILSNGEIASIVILDTIIRLLPGVISNRASIKNDSFFLEDQGTKLLEYPLYTKPNRWKNKSVPSVLLSGNDKKIEEWKKIESINITKKNRPDLFEK